MLMISEVIWFPSFADYSQGFGGKFGVQTDRQDKSAAGWDHIEKVDKHESQKGKESKKIILSIFLLTVKLFIFLCWLI